MNPTVTAYAHSQRTDTKAAGFRVLSRRGWFRLPMDKLAARPLLIGRTTVCDFRIRHDTISRKHCSIARSLDGRLYMIDEQSKNGIKVAKRGHCGKYRVVQWVALEVGDMIRLGNIRMIVVDRNGNCPIQINECADLVRFALQIYGSEKHACKCLNVPRSLWSKICERLEVNA